MIDSVATLTLQQAVRGLGLRQQVIANNVANLQTPDFIASKVSFESSLADAVAQGDPATAVVTAGPTNDMPGINGNNVSLTKQVVAATKTGLQESLLAGTLTSEYGLISTVLKGAA